MDLFFEVRMASKTEGNVVGQDVTEEAEKEGCVDVDKTEKLDNHDNTSRLVN